MGSGPASNPGCGSVGVGTSKVLTVCGLKGQVKQKKQKRGLQLGCRVELSTNERLPC